MIGELLKLDGPLDQWAEDHRKRRLRELEIIEIPGTMEFEAGEGLAIRRIYNSVTGELISLEITSTDVKPKYVG
jgi:hypothetical protein